MPPKSQITSFLQSLNRTSSHDVRGTQLLFEFGSLSLSDGNEGESHQSNTLTAAIQNEPALLIEPVPRSVKVGPEVPQMAKEAGRTLRIKQLWEGTVTEVYGQIAPPSKLNLSL